MFGHVVFYYRNTFNYCNKILKLVRIYYIVGIWIWPWWSAISRAPTKHKIMWISIQFPFNQSFTSLTTVQKFGVGKIFKKSLMLTKAAFFI